MIIMVVEKLIAKKFSGFAANVRTYGVRINVNEIADSWMKRSEYGTTSVFSFKAPGSDATSTASARRACCDITIISCRHQSKCCIGLCLVPPE
jgi:hypothetical protein